jgi:hypothetical protein
MRPIDDIPPAEAEERDDAMLDQPAIAAYLNPKSPPANRGAVQIGLPGAFLEQVDHGTNDPITSE